MKHAVEHRLEEQAEAAADLLALLRDRDMDDDAELVSDTIEGETGFMEALDQALDEIDRCAVIVDGCKEAEARLAKRRNRAAARSEKVRAAIEQAMYRAGLKSETRPTGTLTLRETAPAPVIEDEALIPSEYWVAQDPKLDKKALNAAAKGGAEIPGVRMSNGGVSLTIRRA